MPNILPNFGLRLDSTGRLTYTPADGPERCARLGLRPLLLMQALAPTAGSAPLRAVCRKVWGRADVPSDRVRTLAYRVNEKLAELGCPVELGVEVDRVVVRARGRPDDGRMTSAERRRRVAELRGRGMSLRAIAGEVGVSHEQVRQDLAESPAGNPPSGTGTA